MPAGSIMRTNARVITTTFPSKILQLSLNGTNADCLEGRAPLKKMVIDCAMGVMLTKSVALQMEGTVVPAASGKPNLVLSTSSPQMQERCKKGQA
ncbi:hypothetical protein SDJN03_28984, partial [Cucurbita argyrosperma subsp. sororia]